MLLIENNTEPAQKDKSILMLNSLLLSKELDPARPWVEKKYPVNTHDRQLFENIQKNIIALAQNKDISASPEILLIV